MFCAVLRQLRGELGLVEQQAAEALLTAEKYEIAVFLSFSRVLKGWTTTQKGDEKAGSAQMREGIQIAQTWGFAMWVPYFRMLLAEAQLRAGRIHDGLNIIHETLEGLEHTDERWVEAELYRLKGELILGGGIIQGLRRNVADLNTLMPPHQAEACFLKAVEIAQKQQARSLELRAIVSLARLWKQQGKGAEARQLLAKTYNWFTEGLATADLLQAKALLDELKMRASSDK